MTSSFAVITAPANTDQHEINFDAVLDSQHGEAGAGSEVFSVSILKNR